MTQRIDLGFGQVYTVILRPDYSIMTVLDREDRLVPLCEEHRPRLYEKLSIIVYDMAEAMNLI